MIKKLLKRIFGIESKNTSASRSNKNQDEIEDEDSDLVIAKSQLRWFFDGKSINSVSQKIVILDLDFRKLFPETSKLISLSKITQFQIGDDVYRLYGWKTKEGNSCGWVCKFELYQTDFPILKEHQLLLQNIGGIVETWDEYDEGEVYTPFSLNQNFMFLASKCFHGIGANIEPYLEMCEEGNFKPFDNFVQLIGFAKEENGDLTLYREESGDVFIYAHDTSYDYAEAMIDQPKNTFYKIPECEKFVDYVEKLSRDWLKNIETNIL